ncbi:DUF3772 domain-containing protein [Cognatishimia sp. WU-CL00825]|uniref:DUF3772 domain-containing protein n=1 Tax=Cognatishimia sp. WU-CL00825 TaxID=3127658 RepID=UPI003109A454
MRHALRLIIVTVLLISSAVSLWAQTGDAPDYTLWQNVATRASEAVEAGRASDVALEELRQQLVDWRMQFDAARTTNANSIQIVENQLTALGDQPETASEPTDIRLQRQDLSARLSELQAPARTADVAYSKADGLIRSIDAIIRNRKAEELLELGPTPLNPVAWPSGLAALSNSTSRIASETVTAWQNPSQQTEFRENLPKVLLLLALAFLLLARGREWFERLAYSVQSQSASMGRWLAASAISLGQIILPFVGLLALIEAAYATELAGLRGELVLSTLPQAGFAVLASFWLGTRVFPKSDQVMPFIRLAPEERREGRLLAGALGISLALDTILSELARYDSWSTDAISVVYLPLFVLAGLMLLRLAVLLAHHDTQSHDSGYRDRLVAILGRLLTGIAIVAIALAAIGYFNAAQRLIFPSIISLQILAFVLVLQRVATAVFAVVTGTEDTARQSLIPVLLGFFLVLAAVPFLAMVWGTRASELNELWTAISKGLTIGETRISPTDFFTFILIFFAGYMLTRLLQGALKNTVLPKTKMDVGGQNAIVSGLGYIGIFLAALVAITAAGIDLSSIALVAGALSVGIGFGLQNVVSNFVSGIILLIERPISEGDWIEVNGNMGYVRDISVRSTRIETFDRTDVIVPNADLVSGTVTNFTRGNTVGRVIVPVGVAYGTDPRRIETILLDIATSHPMVLDNPAPSVVFQGFGASSLDFEIRAILRDVNWVLSVKSEMNFEIAKRFMDEGIEIPFAQTDIWFRNPETLAQVPKKTSDSSAHQKDKDSPE